MKPPYVPPAAPRRRAKPRPAARLSLVRVRGQTVIVVAVETWVLHDPFEADLIISAIQLTYHRAVVLYALEPCGCRAAYGLPDLVNVISAMPPEALQWRIVAFDFSRVTRS